MTYESMISAQV